MKRFLIPALAIILAAACTENKKVEEPAAPIGDRAFYEVAGNVESIVLDNVAGEFLFLGQKPTFDKEGLFFVKDIKYKETTEGDFKVLEMETDDEDGGGDEFVACKYDSKGRLVEVTFWEASFSNLKYDDQNRLISYSAYGMMGIESEYHYTLEYGKDRNPVKVTIEEVHPDYEQHDVNTQTYSFSYEYTAVDEKGNWTERKKDDGTVEKRTIKYYPAE
ncbi:MAG: hypothetical protein IK103_01715 [Bacteroidales bacterium]|nr:hypothetical protein [Bacteroidales bacterium]